MKLPHCRWLLLIHSENTKLRYFIVKPTIPKNRHWCVDVMLRVTTIRMNGWPIDCMTSWSIAPSLVDGHLGPSLWSDAAARDGRDARDWLTGLATVGRCQRLVVLLLAAVISSRHYWIRNQVHAEQSYHPCGATSTTLDHVRLIWRRDGIMD